MPCDLERKDFILSCSLQSVMKGNQSRNLSRGHGIMLLPGLLSWFAQFTFLCYTKGCAQWWHDPQWVGPPTSIINQENAPMGPFNDDIFSIKIPFSQMTLACIRLTRNLAVQVYSLRGILLLDLWQARNMTLMESCLPCGSQES